MYFCFGMQFFFGDNGEVSVVFCNYQFDRVVWEDEDVWFSILWILFEVICEWEVVMEDGGEREFEFGEDQRVERFVR